MIAGQIGVYFIKLGGVGACRIEEFMQILLTVILKYTDEDAPVSRLALNTSQYTLGVVANVGEALIFIQLDPFAMLMKLG